MELIEIVTNPRTIYFLGAGASWDSGLPLGDDCSNIIIRNAFSHINRIDLWNKICKFAALNKVNLWPRFEVLLDVFSEYIPLFPLEIVKTFKNVGLSSTHQFLSQNCKGPHLWLTTNFDDQIERCLANLGHSFRVISDKNIIKYLNNDDLNNHLILKLHGDIESIDPENSLGVRIDQILRAFPESAKSSLLKLTNQRPILFIGYAARDPDLFEVVESLITNTHEVAWIGLNEAPEHVKALILKHRYIQYYSDGSPKSIIKEINGTIPKAITEENKWHLNLNQCMINKSNQDISQVLSTICLEINSHESKKAAEEILNLIREDNPIHYLWKMDKQIELLLRSEQANQNELETYKIKLTSFINTIPQSQTLNIINALSTLAKLCWRTSEILKAEEMLIKAHELCKGIKNSELQIRILTELGVVRIYIGLDTTQAGLNNLEQARKIAHCENKPILEYEATQNLAIYYMKVEQAPVAEEILLQIRDTVNEIGNTRPKLIWMLNLAECYRLQRKFIKAIETNQELLFKARICFDNEILMNASNNLGLCFIFTGEVEEAEKAILLSLDSAMQMNNGMAVNNAYYNLGWLRVLLGIWKEAVPYFEKAITGYRLLGLQEMEGGAMSLMAWCKYCLGLTDEAKLIIAEINARHVEPKYIFRSEYNLIKYSLLISDSSIQQYQLQIDSIFNNEPEQKFLFLAWFLDSHINVIPPEIFEKYLRTAYETIEKSSLNIFHQVLNKIIKKRDCNSIKYIV
jgi:tetratricopeptide (TPR) repeat protein